MPQSRRAPAFRSPAFIILMSILFFEAITQAVPVTTKPLVRDAVETDNRYAILIENALKPRKLVRPVFNSIKSRGSVIEAEPQKRISRTQNKPYKLRKRPTLAVTHRKKLDASVRDASFYGKKTTPKSISAFKMNVTLVERTNLTALAKKSSPPKVRTSIRTNTLPNASRRNVSSTTMQSDGHSKKYRNQRKASLGLGAIPTNVTALNSSISVVQHKSFRNGELFCYIRGVCRLGDGNYMLPAWMERHNDTLARCGLTNIMYVLHLSEGSGSGRPKLVLEGFPRAKVNVSDEFREIDVIGAKAPRPERQNLVTDLTPTILLADIFKRPHMFGGTIFSRCIEEHNGTGCADADALFPRSLNASLLVDVGLSAVKDHLWPKGVIRLLRNGFEGSLQVVDLQDIYGWRFRNHASCFRSLLVTNATVPAFAAASKARATHNTSWSHRNIIRADNFMYQANGLSRVPITELSRMGRARCDIKVLLMDRVGQGRILGLYLLTNALAMLNVRLMKAFPSTSVLAEAVYFQNVSFHEQIRVMQESEIVVASHSELNANLPFLRPRAHFFEILPFGIRPDIFRSLAQAYNIRYRYLHAMPDSEMFKLCVNHYNNEISDEVDFLLARWNTAAKKFINATNLNASAPTYFYLSEDQKDESYGELRNIKTCAMMQRVSANVKHLAESVFRVAMAKCGIRSSYAQKRVFFGR